MEYELNEIRHVGFYVKDIEKSRFFYEEILGLKPVVNARVDKKFMVKWLLVAKDLDFVKYKVGRKGTLFEIISFVGNYDTRVPHFQHVAFTVKNIHKLYKKLMKNNIFCADKPIKNEHNTHYVMFCRDYDFNLIELVEEIK